MLGGAQAVREPWRNLYAHLMAEMGWAEFAMNFAELDLFADLAATAARDSGRDDRGAASMRRCLLLREAVRRGRCGAEHRRERQAYEGEAAARLEAMVDRRTLRDEDESSPIRSPSRTCAETACPISSRWRCGSALLGDLILRRPRR